MKNTLVILVSLFVFVFPVKDVRSDVVAGFEKHNLSNDLTTLKYLYEMRSKMVSYSRASNQGDMNYIQTVQGLIRESGFTILNSVDQNAFADEQIQLILKNNLFILARENNVYVFFLGGNARQHGAILNDTKWVWYPIGNAGGYIKKELKSFFDSTKNYLIDHIKDYAQERRVPLNQLHYTLIGHSMGGGSAPLFATHLLRNIFEFDSGDKIHVLLLGPIPVFDVAMTQFYNDFLGRNTINIIHKDDINWPCEVHSSAAEFGVTFDHIGTFVQTLKPIVEQIHVIDGYTESLRITPETAFVEREKEIICPGKQ
jgi:hypothetical protein